MKKHKKYLAVILSLVMVLSLIPVSASAASVGVIINGKAVTFTTDSGAPFIDSASRTQVPLRATMEAYGCEVGWDNSTRTAIVEKDGTTVKVPIGASYILVNGNKITNDTAAIIKDNRTYLPIRAVLEAFGGYVTWNASKNSVEVDSTAQLLKVHFIDVGQADAALIDIGETEILIDAGNNGDGQTVVNYIKPYVDGSLDCIVATHPDADHIGGMDTVLAAYDVAIAIDAGITSSSATFNDYQSALLAEGCDYYEDDTKTFTLGYEGATIDIIETGDGWDDTNDCSVVVQLNYGDTSVLFTGDMGSDVEADNLNQFEDIDVLKVGHHGSKYSSSASFLNKVKPEYAIVSAAKGNSYSHPHTETLQRLFAVGAKVLGTHKSGTIMLSTNGKAYNLNKSNYLTLADAGDYSATTTTPSTPTTGTTTNPSTSTTSPEVSYTYIGNKNSKIFHESTCASVKRMKDSNKVSFSSRSSAVSAGYTPCKNCNP